MIDIYYRRADGALGHWQGPDEAVFTLPDGGEIITRGQYDAAAAELAAAHEQYLADLRQADRERLQADLNAVRALGVPEATARRLVGWNAEQLGEPEAAA
ncbi:hypothetical protein [Nonomuraea rubra]|uniref:hypothetical protein n=1 Tax=Nonomuraea rubra TaxID=46180 RepID=UPI0033ED27F3